MKKNMKRNIIITVIMVAVLFPLGSKGYAMASEFWKGHQNIVQITEDINWLDATLSTKESKISTLQTENNTLTSDNAKAYADIAKLTEEKSSLQNKVRELEDAKNSSNANVERLTRELEDKKREISDKVNEINNKLSEIERLNVRINELNNNIAKLTSEKDSLKGSLGQKEAELVNMTNERNFWKAEKEKSDDLLKQAEKEVSDLKSHSSNVVNKHKNK